MQRISSRSRKYDFLQAQSTYLTYSPSCETTTRRSWSTDRDTLSPRMVNFEIKITFRNFLSSIFPFRSYFFFFSSFSSISSDHSNRADFHFDRGASCSNSSEFQGKWFCDWRWPERQFNFPDPQACTGLVIRLKFNPILMHDMQIPEKQAPLLRIYLDQSFKVD